MNTSVFGGLIKDKPKRKRKEMQAEIDQLYKQITRAGDGFKEIHRLACPSPGVVIDWSAICEIAVTELHKCRWAIKQLDEIKQQSDEPAPRCPCVPLLTMNATDKRVRVSVNTKPAESEIEKQIEDRVVFAGLPCEVIPDAPFPGKLWISQSRNRLHCGNLPVRVMVIRSNIAYFAYAETGEKISLPDIYQRMIATDADGDGSILAIMDDRYVARRVVAAMFPDDFHV